MRKLKPWLVILLVFAAGLFIGTAGTRHIVRQKIKEAVTDPAWLQKRVERDLLRDLALDPAQQSNVHAIVGRTLAQVTEARRDLYPRYSNIIHNGEQEIRRTLNPEQQTKFDEMVRKKSLKRRLP